MKEKHIMKSTKHKTNWKKVKEMTDKQIEATAKADPDAYLLTDIELHQFKRVIPPKSVDVRAIRKKLHLSQEQFANYFGVSKRTIQEWEQKRRTPNTVARNFLKVIANEPVAVQRALFRPRKKRARG